MSENCINTKSVSDSGLWWGAIAVVGFSLSLPATRLAVSELDGVVVGLGRAMVAALPATLLLVAGRCPVPPRRLWPRLSLTALGVVFGFPLLSAWALTLMPAAHGAVIAGLLPAATAAMAAFRGGERPSLGFWLAMLLGLVGVLVFALVQGTGRPQPADGMILLAVVLGGLGYAEGGALARELGGWRVICWVLVASTPFLLPIVVWRALATGLHASPASWGAFAYVSFVSMFLGFFAWYRALATGGIARIGQLQLAQPVLTMLWSMTC